MRENSFLSSSIGYDKNDLPWIMSAGKAQPSRLRSNFTLYDLENLYQVGHTN